MSAWGYGLFDDDTALDVKSDFEELVEEGLSIEEATARILEDFAERYSGEDEEGDEEGDDEELADLDQDEHAVVILSLAVLQLDHNSLQAEVRDGALRIIDEGLGLERWEEDPEGLVERKKIYTELREKLTAK